MSEPLSIGDPRGLVESPEAAKANARVRAAGVAALVARFKRVCQEHGDECRNRTCTRVGDACERACSCGNLFAHEVCAKNANPAVRGCARPDCSEPHAARGYCDSHYHKLRYRGRL